MFKAAMEVAKKGFKIAMCQIVTGVNKADNITRARAMIELAAHHGANIVVLPEMFNCPYTNDSFPVFAEEIPAMASELSPEKHQSTHFISQVAKKFGIYLVGGSIPERSGTKLYNTCVVAGPDGQFLAKHRKVHLFDVDVEGGIRFKESDTLSPGSQITTFDTEFCRVGLGICYDIRFPEYTMLCNRAGAQLMIFPAAFNMTTGPLHWELLGRARAIDNQLYVAMVSPARVADASYQAWGHTQLISPWGEVIATTEEKPSMVMGDIDLSEVDTIRQQIPCLSQKRHDLYQLTAVEPTNTKQ